MKKQNESRIYNFPDADLYVQCKERLRYAKRDIKQFTEYGYTKEKMIAFGSMVGKFEGLPDDDEMVGEQMLLTEKKSSSSDKLKSAIRSIMTRVALKYNNRSGRYRKFGTSKMGDMTDPQLLFCGRRVVRVARAQIDFLAEVGINEKSIQKVVEGTQQFENAMNFQQDKVSDRDIAVEQRTILGNKIYNELVVLCNIGKDIWAEIDSVKYENYCIYESNNEEKKARKARKIADELHEPRRDEA